MSAPRPVLFMLTRDTKTRSVPFGSTSESETIAGTCCSRRKPSILCRSSSPCFQGNCTTQPSWSRMPLVKAWIRSAAERAST